MKVTIEIEELEDGTYVVEMENDDECQGSMGGSLNYTVDAIRRFLKITFKINECPKKL